MATITDLQNKANSVANATQVGENTAARVGGALQDAANLIADLQTQAAKAIEAATNAETKGEQAEKAAATATEAASKATVLMNKAVRGDVAQALTDAEKAQALANVGISGIDDEPTAGSNSLVKSGGIYDAIQDVYKKSNYNDGDNIIDFNTIHIIKDNPEFAIAAVDVNNKILYGIKADGQPYWGVGVPKAVKDYVDKQVNLISFDISAYHATGGTLATYDNLEDALGTNGENIPQNLRKGGMSVKFVQTSDNKYVQFRLMSDSFNTTVKNWQGIDDKPTAGSDNLVKSGGVALIENYNFGNDIIGGRATRNGGFYNNNGSVEIRGGKAYYCGTTDFIDVSNIVLLQVKKAFVQAANTLLLVAYNSNKEALLEYSVESEYTGWHKDISFIWAKESPTVKYIRLTCEMQTDTQTSTIAVNPDAYVKKSIVDSIVGFYNKQKLENTVFSDSAKYIIKLEEDIILSKNVTLPKYCVLDFNGYYIDATSYSLISPEGSVTELTAKRSYGYCLKGSNISGKFYSPQGIYFSNLWDTSNARITPGIQERYKNKLIAILSSFINTKIILDYSIQIDGATIGDDIEVAPKNLIIESLDTQKILGFFRGLTIQKGGKFVVKNVKFQQKYNWPLYVAGNIELYGVNSEFKSIELSSANNVLKDCKILAPVKLMGDNNIVTNCICISDDTKYNICVSSNNNIIKNNKVSGGIVGILVSPTASSKVIENNIIKDNVVDSIKEEAISFDWVNNTGYKNLFTFDSFVNGKTLRGSLASTINDYTPYIGSVLYGISENSIGKFCKIKNIIDSEVEGKVDIELDYEIFEYDVSDNAKVYNNDGILNNKGYIDYRNTLWVIGCVFLNNFCDNNIINGGWSLDIYGAAFGNILTNNIINGDYGIGTGRLYIGAPQSTKNGKTYNAAVCKNIVKNNIIPSCRMSSIYNGANISEGCVATSLRYNVYIGNICENIYICDKYSYIDTGGYVIRKTNPPYDYNTPMFRHAGENLTPVLYSEDDKMMVKGKTIVTKDSGVYKIFNGQFSDNYGQEPIKEDLA